MGLELDAAFVKLGEVEHVVDDAEQGLAGVGDQLDVTLVAGVEGAGLLQQPGEPDDGAERSAQLVGHVGQEVGLGRGRGLRLGLLATQLVFHRPAQGHIPEHRHGPDHGAVIVMDRRRRALQPGPAPVRAQHPELGGAFR